MSTELFDPTQPYTLAPTVSLRPEPFGALVYDFATRRLSFLKTAQLVRVVRELADQPNILGALHAAGVSPTEYDTYVKALAELSRAGSIQRRFEA
ncbi:mycofactocin biosynthesis chaperone MftB [Nocardia cyriacigeorgica]|uniref:mycofactocin biosynthesis chaperone MftB n=1 Tax=Nocardia cyriacigeorgica TaxID=135487 RepID=UPI001892DF89|nr:mycofactocin biosynthesis chaperone MftB [Nocardia cyriacigeorgica]MBF6288658.1 mycofactocin biosynthesis chaperone MftB [Nocardia cyriacigeorgica]